MEGREANKRLKNYHEASEDELEEEEDEDEVGDEDRGMSTDESTESSAHSSRCGSPTFRSNGDKKKKKLIYNKNGPRRVITRRKILILNICATTRSTIYREYKSYHKK